jgi:hypothetical protein
VGVPEDLDLLEKSIRALQIEWEKFFGGVERKPPNEMKGRVEALIRKHANSELRNNAERFRYQNLTARYNTFAELWGKRLRALEEGRPVGLHGRAAAAPAPIAVPPPPAALSAPAASAAPPTQTPRRPAPDAAGVRIKDPVREAEALRGLYEGFLEARKQAGEGGGVKFESFQKLIAQQAERILKEKGGKAVDFRLETKDGKVSLKAKAVK